MRDNASGHSLSDAPVRSYPRRWWGVAVLALAVIILAIDMTVLNFALPAISRDLDPSGTQMLWIVDIYAFVIATLLITMGTLGDRIGRRRLLLWGIAGFGAASLLAAYSVSPMMLIVARALQGVAGATLMPSTLSLIKAMFPDKNELPRAIAVWISCYSVGAIIGPVLGGWLLEHFHWGAVFIINIPVAVAVIVGGLLILPESKSAAPGRFDVLGAVLSMVALFGVVGALKAATAGLPWWAPALLATVALLAAGALVLAAVLGPEGLVHLSNWEFLRRLLCGLVFGAAIIGPWALAPESRVLTHPFMQALGRWSYGIFLWHMAALSVAFPLLGVTIFSGHIVAVTLVTVALTVPLAAVSYALVEEPARRWLGAHWAKPTKVSAPTSTS